MEMKDYMGKNIYVKLNSDRVYTGEVLEVVFVGKDESGADIWIISMKDKFGNLVSFSKKEIKYLQTEK